MLRLQPSYLTFLAFSNQMVSHYIAHVIRCLDRAKTIPSDQIRKMLGMEDYLYQELLAGTDGSQLSLTHVDNLVNFFGMGIFQDQTVKYMFINNETLYKSWENLDTEDQKMINIAQLYTGTAANGGGSKMPLRSLNYAKDCAYFLESCDNMVSIIKDADVGDEDEEENDT